MSIVDKILKTDKRKLFKRMEKERGEKKEKSEALNLAEQSRQRELYKMQEIRRIFANFGLAYRGIVDRNEKNAWQHRRKYDDQMPDNKIKIIIKPEYEELYKTCSNLDCELKYIVSCIRLMLISKYTNKSMKCPSCGQVKLIHRNWTIHYFKDEDKNKEQLLVICRSCNYVRRNSKIKQTPEKLQNLLKFLFAYENTYYKLNAMELYRLREFYKISVKEFAKLCKWPMINQYKYEEKDRIIKKEIAKKICDVFEVPERTALLFSERFDKYYLNGVVLKRIREYLEISIKSFSEIIGWSQSYQRLLEFSERRLIFEDKKKVVEKAINKILELRKELN